MRRIVFVFSLVTGGSAVLSACMAPSISADPEPAPLDASENETAEPPPPNEPRCDEYCDAVMDACKGGFAASGSNAQFPSRVACTEFCDTLGSGSYADRKGDTIG